VRQWLQFGPYHLDVSSRSLFCESAPVSLTPKSIEMLRVLAQAGGSVVTKEMFLKEVWPGTFVEESSITRNISELRSALGKREDGTSYIETFPRRGYRLSGPVLRMPDAADQTPSGKKILAVLPFRIMGMGFSNNSIGLRIADALITRLATTRVFNVRPTGTVSQYEQSGNGRATAGKDLEADFVLDGSVQEFGETIRITAQLLDARSAKTVWGETFDQESRDVLGVQDSFAEQLAGALTMFMSAEDRKLLSRKYTGNSEAYQLYLQGRFHWNQRSEKGLRTAIQWFRKAIGVDPEYALAYSGLAASYAMLPMLASVRAKQFMPKARTAAVKAMDLDESLVEARTALAFVEWHYDWDWRRAEREFKIALEFQPDHATIHQWYALLLVEMGRFADGISEANKARALDPGSASIRANLSTVLYLANRYQESIDAAQEGLALDPESLRAHLVMGGSLEQIGKLDEAIAFFGKACCLSRDAPYSLGWLGHAYGVAGRVAEATSVLKNLRRRRPRRFFEEALASLGLGSLPETFESLDRACDERQFPVVLLRADPRFRRLHSTPEFRSILSRIGLAP